jgi:hypothetical protein
LVVWFICLLLRLAQIRLLFEQIWTSPSDVG